MAENENKQENVVVEDFKRGSLTVEYLKKLSQVA